MFRLLARNAKKVVRKIIGNMNSPEKSRYQIRSRRAAEPWWYVDHMDTGPDGTLKFSGWALQDPGVPSDVQARRFFVNDKPPIAIEYPLPRPDVQKVLWQISGAEMSGFSLVAPAEFPDGVMEIRCSNSLSNFKSKGRESWFAPDPALHHNLPDPDRRFRVIGNRDAAGFLMIGATDAFRIKAAYENVTGKSWDEVGAVLDWGCGCGRIARHLAPHLGERFFGCDIDSDNISWCSANLPGSYKPSLLSPPLPYVDNSFDVIYGVSVFTHLRAPWELRWLEELHRVLRPGGVILMTIHGQTALDFAGLGQVSYNDLMDKVEREGLVVTSTNDQLNGFVECPDEYVNVFHAKWHVQKVWGKYFQRIEQIPGYIFTHDLVVGVIPP